MSEVPLYPLKQSGVVRTIHTIPRALPDIRREWNVSNQKWKLFQLEKQWHTVRAEVMSEVPLYPLQQSSVVRTIYTIPHVPWDR